MGVEDKWADQKSFNTSEIDESFKSFGIEMMFLNNDENGEGLKTRNLIRWDCQKSFE